MFSLIWRFFPGPAWLRALVILGVVAGVVYALITWGYPWFSQFFDEETSTVGS